MGDWAIVVRGTGCHHNKRPDIDADIAAAELVKKLKAQGHTIKSATFTSGGEQSLDEQSYAGLLSSEPLPSPSPKPHDDCG